MARYAIFDRSPDDFVEGDPQEYCERFVDYVAARLPDRIVSLVGYDILIDGRLAPSEEQIVLDAYDEVN
jgi:hypothetical protein